MPVTVNGVELTDAEIEQELPAHQDSADPLRQAVVARILRRVLLDEAQRLGIDTRQEDQAIDALLASQAPYPTPDAQACRRFYAAHPERFTVGALVEADHILFQVTPDVNLAALRGKAEQVLQEALADPTRFADLARCYSNCPSGQLGGSLGQIRRGDTVAEFERALFAMEAGKVHPALVNSRHGLHIVRVVRSVPGQLLPYERVADEIATVLDAMARDTAWRQYTKVLVARAHIDGIDLEDQAERENIMGASHAPSVPVPHTPDAAGHSPGKAHAGCSCGGGSGQGGCA
ncbi:peptidylprolyl isomerase [Lampropedia cohaerens]|uniref:peptidylprolyl isomerase n=1 Tax=Lampropedia cohaerens TaxID=1610491 RepID=UPI000A07CAE3